MVRKALIVFLGLGLLAFTISVFLSMSGSTRHKLFRVGVELPAVFYYFQLRSPMTHRDFDRAADLLDSQLNMVERFASGRNTMIPGLVTNTRFVMEQAAFDKDYTAMFPFLQRLVRFQGDLFEARIWLAEALLVVDPQKVFEHTEAARTLISSDERPYRLAIAAATKLNNATLLRETCRQYESAEFGAYHFHEYNTLFMGSGLREFGLEIVGTDSKQQDFVSHLGLRIGENIAYEFSLSGPRKIEDLRLHFASPPGILIRIENIGLSLQGLKQATLGRGDFTIMSRRGFQTAEGTVTAARNGERIWLNIDPSLRADADMLTLTLSVSRLDLTAHSVCRGIG